MMLSIDDEDGDKLEDAYSDGDDRACVTDDNIDGEQVKIV